MDLVTVYEARDELMANSVRDLLQQSGIGAMTRPRHVGAYGVMLSDPAMFGLWGEVLVYGPDVDRAQEHIAGFLGTLGLLEEANASAEELEVQALEADHSAGAK